MLWIQITILEIHRHLAEFCGYILNLHSFYFSQFAKTALEDLEDPFESTLQHRNYLNNNSSNSIDSMIVALELKTQKWTKRLKLALFIKVALKCTTTFAPAAPSKPTQIIYLRRRRRRRWRRWRRGRRRSRPSGPKESSFLFELFVGLSGWGEGRWEDVQTCFQQARGQIPAIPPTCSAGNLQIRCRATWKPRYWQVAGRRKSCAPAAQSATRR